MYSPIRRKTRTQYYTNAFDKQSSSGARRGKHALQVQGMASIRRVDWNSLPMDTVMANTPGSFQSWLSSPH